MKRMNLFLTMLALASLACALGAPKPVALQTEPAPAGHNSPTEAVIETTNTDNLPVILLFTIGMHIEPLGQTAQGYNRGQGDYHQPQLFQRHVQDILAVTQIVESHGGRMTIQTQSPFTTVAIESGNTILADLGARGHEMALHFHEDAHLGKNDETLSVQQWCDVMKEEIGYIKQASGVTDIRYWSGGNLYVAVYKAASCAGLDVNSDWKNPKIQETPLEFVGVNPWRPAGGTDGINLNAFTQHDPNGTVIFLPDGLYDKSNFASMRRSDNAGGDEAYFEFLKESLYASLSAADSNKVNVFHFTVHPGEFRGDKQDPFGVIDRFLTEVVDPLVASGQVQWATFSEMADAYTATEK